MTTLEQIQAKYPLHWLVWNNNHTELEQLLKDGAAIEEMDARGRTPLMLAVTLCHLESAQTLLEAGANVNCENSDGWTVVQEAVATGDPVLLNMIVSRRDFQRYSNRIAGIPQLLQRLKDAPDFYVEMKWEFTSWVPLVSKLCPSDTYKVYKQGSNVRIDTTLLGFDQVNWKRGNKSYIFKGQTMQRHEPVYGTRSYIFHLNDKDESATMMEVDHDSKQVYVGVMHMAEASSALIEPADYQIEQRLTTPLTTTYVDMDKINFERNKTGIWGWRSDKTELINDHECRVFGASNVELVMKTRTEHLADSDKAKAKLKSTPLQSFLGMSEIDEKTVVADDNLVCKTHTGNPCNISAEEYFSATDLQGRDIGRPREETIKIQKFKATLWLCEDYPLSLQEQIMPIVDLMAISNSHFAKLKDFIQMQLPNGFPVKIEIPLFHVVNARITFGNIFAMDESVPDVVHVEQPRSESPIDGASLGAARKACIIDDKCFEVPSGYTHTSDNDTRQFSMDADDDDLLQYAIQQSLVEAGSERDEVDIWEALKGQRPSRAVTPNPLSDEESQLQRAIQESLVTWNSEKMATDVVENNSDIRSTASSRDDDDEQLRIALMLSQKEVQQAEKLRRQEQQLLDDILKLSLHEK